MEGAAPKESGAMSGARTSGVPAVVGGEELVNVGVTEAGFPTRASVGWGSDPENPEEPDSVPASPVVRGRVKRMAKTTRHPVEIRNNLRHHRQMQ